MSTKATLNGFPLIGTVTWVCLPGQSPYQTTVEMEAGAARAVFAAVSGAFDTLAITPDGGGSTVTVEKLSVLDIVPTGSPWTLGLVLADRRWRWPRKHILRRYNIQRRTGNVSVIRDDDLRNVRVSIPEIRFAAWSLNGANRWNARTVLFDVMNELDPKGTVVFDRIDSLDDMPINNLEIDDPGDAAISRVMAHLPGTAVTVDLDGSIRFYAALAQEEGSAISCDVTAGGPGGPAVVGKGWSNQTDHSLLRPSKITVYFNREIECRFDRKEAATSVTSALVNAAVCTLENVLPNPEAELDVNGVTVGRGQWITFGQAFAAWADTTPEGFLPLDSNIIASEWVGQLIARRQAGISMLPAVDWDARISAVLQHYHYTYRIPQAVMQRIYQIRANRVAILNPTDGTRAPSPCWMDYCFWPTGGGTRWAVEVSSNAAAETFGYGRNVKGYSNALKGGRSSPVVVSVRDEDQGIIDIRFAGDYLNAYTVFVPSACLNLPTVQPTGNLPRFFLEKPASGKECVLDEDFGMATILTVAFGSPNSRQQLQPIDVTPDQAESVLRGSSFSPATGPPVQLRVGPQTMTARFGWQDIPGYADEVRKTIGIIGWAPGETHAADGSFDQSWLNQQWINREDCEDVAKAMAAAYYADLVDRVVGAKTVGLCPSMTLRGSMSSVVHQQNADGSALTTGSTPQFPSHKRGIFGLLPDKVRALVMRLVQLP